MTDYKATRERIGTQVEVAARLGVARSTVARRETGTMPITEEAANALLWLVRGGTGGRKRVAPKRREAPNDEAQRLPEKARGANGGRSDD